MIMNSDLFLPEEQFEFIQKYCEESQRDEIGVLSFLFSLSFDNSDENQSKISFNYLLKSCINNGNFCCSTFGNAPIINILLSKISQNIFMLQEAIQLISVILFKTESRRFLFETDFFPMVKDFEILNSNNLLILSIFSSPMDLTAPVIEAFMPYLKSIISINFPNDSYRVFLSYLTLFQCGYRINDYILSNGINVFINTEYNYMIEILTRLIFYLENPHPYFDWILKNMLSSDLVIMKTSVETLFQCWDKWNNEQKLCVMNIINENISNFPFIIQKKCVKYIVEIGNMQWLSNVCVFEKLLIVLDDEKYVEKTLFVICNLIINNLNENEENVVEMLNVLSENLEILECLKYSTNLNVQKMSNVLIESFLGVKIIDQ